MEPKICSFPECGKPFEAKGLCKSHYRQILRGRTPSALGSRNGAPTVHQRFWAKVDKSGECWVWTAFRDGKGYGKFKVGEAQLFAHRVSYVFSGGEIPDGMQIDHMCHNKSCVNPAHLRTATPKQNNENHSGPRRDNTSGIRGVSWVKSRSRWAASVRHHGRTHTIGYFRSIDDAERAVVAKRLEMHTRNDLDRAP